MYFNRHSRLLASSSLLMTLNVPRCWPRRRKSQRRVSLSFTKRVPISTERLTTRSGWDKTHSLEELVNALALECRFVPKIDGALMGMTAAYSFVIGVVFVIGTLSFLPTLGGG